MYYLTSASFKVRRWPNLALPAPAALAPPSTVKLLQGASPRGLEVK